MREELQLLVCPLIEPEARRLAAEPGFEDISIKANPRSCAAPLIVSEEVAQPQAAESASTLAVGACPFARREATSSPLQPPPSCPHSLRMLAPEALILELQAAGHQPLTPGWLAHWREHALRHGPTHALATADAGEPDAMQTLRRADTLVLLDTGVDPQAPETLRALAKHVGRPSRSMTVGLSHLRLRLETAVLRWRLESKQQRSQAAQVTSANFAMALDLLPQLARPLEEADTAREIERMFSMLCDAERAAFFPILLLAEQAPGQAAAPTSEEGAAWLERLRGKDFLELPAGFCVRVRNLDHQTEGLLLLDGIRHPEHRTQYLNLTLHMMPVCGLAVRNARTERKRQHAEREQRDLNLSLRMALQAKEQALTELREALERVRLLSGLLPMCSHCRRIRDGADWADIETYVEHHSTAKFSHGLCPDCMARHYSE